MTASTPASPGSACQTDTGSPPISRTARRASPSSFEPGNVTTATRGFIGLPQARPPWRARPAPPRGRRGPRSPGSSGSGSPSAPPASGRPPHPRPPPRSEGTSPRRLPRRCPSQARAERSPRPSPAGRAAPPSASPAGGPGTSPRRSHPGEVRVESLAGDALVGLAVPGHGLLDHLGRERGRRRLVVPAGPVQPVPYVLLVEGGLRPAGRVSVGRPEPGGVGGQGLVDQDQLAVREPEH